MFDKYSIKHQDTVLRRVPISSRDVRYIFVIESKVENTKNKSKMILYEITFRKNLARRVFVETSLWFFLFDFFNASIAEEIINIFKTKLCKNTLCKIEETVLSCNFNVFESTKIYIFCSQR